MAASFSQKSLPERVLPVSLSTANTAVAGGMGLSLKGVPAKCTTASATLISIYSYGPILCPLFSTPKYLCKIQLDMPSPDNKFTSGLLHQGKVPNPYRAYKDLNQQGSA